MGIHWSLHTIQRYPILETEFSYAIFTHQFGILSTESCRSGHLFSWQLFKNFSDSPENYQVQFTDDRKEVLHLFVKWNPSLRNVTLSSGATPLRSGKIHSTISRTSWRFWNSRKTKTMKYNTLSPERNDEKRFVTSFKLIHHCLNLIQIENRQLVRLKI